MQRTFQGALATALVCTPFLCQSQTPTIQLSTLEDSKGFTLNGVIGTNDRGGFGNSLSGLGDVNGDGIADFVIGAFNQSPPQNFSNGVAYVVFGSHTPFSASFDGSDLDGLNGFQIWGIDSVDRLGISVSGAGDVNGDGFADLLIGAYGADYYGLSGQNASGEAYVLFGKSGGFPAVVVPSNLDGTNGFTIQSTVQYDRLGVECSGAGDFNGDGFADVLLASRFIDYASNQYGGKAFIIFGKASGFSSTIDISNLNGADGFAINSSGAGDRLGASASGAGDVNGDGYDDVIVSASRAAYIGQSYLIFGTASPQSSVFEISSLNGSNGIVINKTTGSYGSGSVSGAGDMNGDGFADLVIGNYGESTPAEFNAGITYVIFGSRALATPFNLQSIDGSNGFRMEGLVRSDRLGRRVSSAGDKNGDGFFDLIISAVGAGSQPNEFTGEQYLIFGKDTTTPNAFPPLLDIASLSPASGLRYQGSAFEDYSGSSVSGAGDINDDGFADFLIGAKDADPGGLDRAGEAYLIYGASNGSTQTSATYKSFATLGDAPRKAVGISGDGSDENVPASRAWIDFSAGTTSTDEPSLQSVTLIRSNASLQNLSNTATVMWQMATNRINAPAQITLRYHDSEIAGLVEADLRLYAAPTPNGPWELISSPTNPFGGSNPDLPRNQISGAVPDLNSYYALNTENLQPPTADSSVWMILGN